MAFTFSVSAKPRSLEQRQVAFMLATGFFMGVFIATYQVTADSLFLNRMGEYLDKAFLITGALGIISTGIFSFLQDYIRFTVLTVMVIITILAFTIGVYVLLHFGSPEWQNTVVFLMFCFSGPIVALLFLSYWGTFGRLFNFRQSKKIIGWIDTGQLIAAIIASLLIPLSAKLVPDTTDYLLVCAVSIFTMGVLLTIIAFRFEVSKNNPREFEPEVKRESSITRMFSDKYILTMSLMLVVSMTVFVFTQFSFQELVRIQYPDQRSLTDFNAFFIGAVYAMSLIMQTFVNNRIIGNYGLKISLYVLPIFLAILFIGALTTGIVFGYDKVGEASGFIYFFLFVALGRLFNWTLRDSLENPVFKLFFIPLDGRIRFSIQSKVEGLVNESARFVAGLLIFGLAFLPAFEIIHITVLLVVLSVAYFFVVNRLYSGYRGKIRKKLENPDDQQDKLEKGFTRVTQRLEELMALPDTGKAIFSFKLLEKINANKLSDWVNQLVRNDDESVRHYAQDKMNQIKGLSVSDTYVIRLDKSRINPEEKKLLDRTELEQLLTGGGEIMKQRIQRLCRSANPQDRQYGAELLSHTSGDEGLSYLIELLSDSNVLVRNAAITSCVKKHNMEVLNALISNLENPVFTNHVMTTLEIIGHNALPALEASFYRTGQSTAMMLKIVQTMGKISGSRAREMLWNKIDYPNKVVVSQVLLALGECGFKANISQVTRIKYAIESDIADIRWNLSAIQEIDGEGFGQEIIKSLRWEIQNDIEHIYMLLAMLYDTRSIQLVKENIETGTSESITYAVELLDVFLAEQLKMRVIPVLDDISDAERIDKLDAFYPRADLDGRIVLKFIINRDFTQSNRWTKASVIYKIGSEKMDEFKLDLIAHMFNPDSLIREVAAWALNEIAPDEYEANSYRLGTRMKKELDEIIFENKLSRFGIILFFRRVPLFKEIPGITLSRLADFAEEINMKPGESKVLDDEVNNSFFVVESGLVEFYSKGSLIADYSEYQFIGEHVSLPHFLNTNLIVAKDDARIVSIDKEMFYELLSDDVRLADKVLDYV